MLSLFTPWTLIFLFLLTQDSQEVKENSQVGTGRGEVEVRLELRQGGQWQPVDVHTVFHNNDAIRFRFRSSFSGYLFVMNRTSDGQTSWLYPRPELRQDSRVEAGPDYLIPGTKGDFVVSGKPGFDVTEWVVSSVPIAGPWPTIPEFGSQPSTLLPRCRTEDLSASRSCLDSRAGPGPVRTGEAPAVPASGDRPLVARDLTFHTDGNTTHIAAPNVQRKIILYEFRVAHR